MSGCFSGTAGVSLIMTNETTTEFDVEVMDYLQPLDPEMLEGHEDDGVTTVLALGNDLLSDDRSDTGLAALMEKSANATI